MKKEFSAVDIKSYDFWEMFYCRMDLNKIFMTFILIFDVLCGFEVFFGVNLLFR